MIWSIPRRRSWSATSRTPGGSCAQAAGRSSSTRTTSPTRNWARPIPYGVYDVATNEGWCQRRDLRRHRAVRGRERSARGGSISAASATRTPTTLTITADGGGSNSYRTRLWKTELQKLANETGLRIRVCHFPPGTSKWNKIEHRLFSYISINWRGKPLVSRQVDHRPDRRDDDQHRPQGLRPPRPRTTTPQDQGQRRSNSPPSRSNATSSIRDGTTPSSRQLKRSDPLASDQGHRRRSCRSR